MVKNFLILIIGIFFGVFSYFYLKTNQFYQKIYTPKNHQEKPKTKYNFLLFGYGGGKHEGTYLTDTMIFLHLDTASKSATMVSIPRDLWVKLPTKDQSDFWTKINAVYQMELFPDDYPALDKKYLGSKKDATLIKKIVSDLFSQKIDNYAAIDFDGFIKAIDLLSGVEIEIEKSFTDYQYPIEGKENDLCDEKTEELFKKAEPFLKPGYNPEDKEKILKEDINLDEFLKNATESPHLAFPCRYEILSFQKGKVLMDGKTALKYVRSRHANGDGGDFSRARRQQRLLEAVKEKVISLGFLTKAIPLMDHLGNHLKTDLSLTDIKKLIQEGKNAKEYQLKTYVLSTNNLLEETISQDGQYILIPKAGENDWSEIKNKIKEIIEGKEDPENKPSPIPTVK